MSAASGRNEERLCTRCGGVIHRVDIGPDMLGRPVPRWVRIDQRPIGCPAVDRKAYCIPAREKRNSDGH